MRTQPEPPAHEPVESEHLAAMADAARVQVEDTVRRYPYASIAAGVGVGVVLGGGIPSWALRMMATSATRLVVAEAVRRITTPETDVDPAMTHDAK
jgi:hypothetical protein